jgi:hypothetical protein
MELSDEAAVPIPSGRIAACSPFFRRRLDFLKWGFKVTGQRIVRFTLWQVGVVLIVCSDDVTYTGLQHKVFALSGEAGRQFFFSTRGFNLNQGHQYLNGSVSGLTLPCTSTKPMIDPANPRRYNKYTAEESSSDIQEYRASSERPSFTTRHAAPANSAQNTDPS